MNKKIKLHLLVNPVAGNGQSLKVFSKLKTILKEQQIISDYQVSQSNGDLINLANRYANEAHSSNEFLIVIGGDGSLNEVVNGIKSSNHPNLPITYLPAGSGNDFARAANITKDPEKMLSNLTMKPQIKKVDCGAYIDNIKQNKKKYFVNNYGIGFDAFVVHQSNNQRLKDKLNKLHLGNLIYGLNIIDVLHKQDTFTVSVQSNEKIVRYNDTYFVTTTNHPYFGGGIAILPKANIFSHKLDTVIVEKPNLRKFIYLFGKLLKNGSHVNDPHFHYIEADQINVQVNKPEYSQIDGEDGEPLPHNITFKIDSFNLRI